MSYLDSIGNLLYAIPIICLLIWVRLLDKQVKALEGSQNKIVTLVHDLVMAFIKKGDK